MVVRTFRCFSPLIMLVVLVAVAVAGDWPAYRHDAARTGITAEKLTTPLTRCWVFRPLHGPKPAWSDPKPVPVEELLELRRVHFDDAFQLVSASGAVYFGSSANNKVYCLDGATGRVRWTRITGGPVRLAPTLADGRLYVASDDGWAYCLDAADGSEVWKFRAAPEDRRVLGQGKLISLWPSRTGVLVDGGVAYVGAGVFPAEGVFLYALDAKTGQPLWRNDATGEKPQSRVSPQGYLLASPGTLYAPMGRVSPAAFDRRDGRLLYETSLSHVSGGTYALLAGEHLYTGTEKIVALNQTTRDRFATFSGRRIVVTEDYFYVATAAELMAMNRQSKATTWKIPCHCADELVLAGGLLVAGGVNEVMAVEAATGKVAWRAAVEGAAKGLAVANGRLLASTDKGVIYCFGPAGAAVAGEVAEADALAKPEVGKPAAQDGFAARAAEAILEHSGIRRGYCLVYGCEDGHLALELATRSKLMIYAVSPDAQKVAAARKRLDAAGVYGDRVCVEQWPLDAVPYGDYFANLIVSETALRTGQWPGDPSRMARFVKPLGGTVLIGQPDAASAAPRVTADTVREWLRNAAVAGGQLVERKGTWLEFVRGPLPGAGDWTHQYANAGNTACGDDQIAKSPMSVLWFGRPGAGEMMNRHVRAAAPLSLGGRLFIQGENVLMAYDAYNGVELWRRDMPGAQRANASHDGSNLAVCEKGLLVAIGNQCLRLNLDTGQTVATYEGLPPTADKFGRWGYLATDGKLVFGTRAGPAGQSNALFAVDLDTGKRRWFLEDTRLSHHATAVGGDVLFAMRSDADEPERERVLRQSRAALARLPEEKQAAEKQALAKPLVRTVVALDKGSGAVRWQRPLDLTHCGPNPAMMYQDNVLVLFGVYLDGHYWQQFFAGEFAGRRVTALDARDGRTLWSEPVGFRVRPLIIGDTLHAEPWSFDLHTGQPRTRVNPLTNELQRWQFARPGHHCGTPVASLNAMFFRSWNMGSYDLYGDFGTTHFGGQRPGCWINTIPAAGLVLMPEASTGCMCDFPNHGTVVFQPSEQNKAWGWFSAPESREPIRKLALNLGAPGDRRDAGGRLWLGFPRPAGALVMKLEGDAAFYTGGQFVQGNSAYTDVTGTDTPWVFSGGADGLRILKVPLIHQDDGVAVYRVRLGFVEPSQEPGRRVFDILLQGRVVAQDYDIARAAGGTKRAVWAEFTGIEVADQLRIELRAKDPKASRAQLPRLDAVEVLCDRFVKPGCSSPPFVTNNVERKQAGTLRVSNLTDVPLVAKLQIATPPGLTLTAPSEVRVPVGQRADLPLAVAVGDLPPGKHQVGVKLLRSDGALELSRALLVEHLGNRARKAIAAVEDAHVIQRFPTRNYGKANVLLVDGGNAAMNDADHALGLMKFRWKLPSKPVRVQLRLTNAGNPTGDGGRICVVEGAWEETKTTYATRPKLGRELTTLGAVDERQVLERELDLDLPAEGEISLAIDPTSTDGVDYVSREGGPPAELRLEYELTP